MNIYLNFRYSEDARRRSQQWQGRGIHASLADAFDGVTSRAERAELLRLRTTSAVDILVHSLTLGLLLHDRGVSSGADAGAASSEKESTFEWCAGARSLSLGTAVFERHYAADANAGAWRRSRWSARAAALTCVRAGIPVGAAEICVAGCASSDMSGLMGVFELCTVVSSVDKAAADAERRLRDGQGAAGAAPGADVSGSPSASTVRFVASHPHVARTIFMLNGCPVWSLAPRLSTNVAAQLGVPIELEKLLADAPRAKVRVARKTAAKAAAAANVVQFGKGKVRCIHRCCCCCCCCCCVS